MNRNISLLLMFFIGLVGCFNSNKITTGQSDKTYTVRLDTLTWFDSARNRTIPVALYTPKTDVHTDNQKIVIFSHGYGQNKGGDYLTYSYLTEYLASKGFCAKHSTRIIYRQFNAFNRNSADSQKTFLGAGYREYPVCNK